MDGAILVGVDSVEKVKVTLIPELSLTVVLSINLAVVVSEDVGILDETLLYDGLTSTAKVVSKDLNVVVGLEGLEGLESSMSFNSGLWTEVSVGPMKSSNLSFFLVVVLKSSTLSFFLVVVDTEIETIVSI